MTTTEKQSIRKQQRRLSYSSSLIMEGCMPGHIGLDNPTITIICTFDEPPKIDSILSNVETFFQFHRLSTVPKPNKLWEFQSVGKINPSKMVRQLSVCCDSEEEWAEIVQQQRKVNLRREDLPWWEFVLMINEGKGDHLLLFRIDHGVADGLSLAKVFPSILKRMDGSDVSTLIPESMISSKAKATNNIFTMAWKMPKAILDVLLSPIGRADDRTAFSKNIVGDHVVRKEMEGVKWRVDCKRFILFESN